MTCKNINKGFFMRHNKSYKKLGRVSDHRNALLRNLTRSLFISGQIETTLIRAKALKPVVEKAVTKAKLNTVAAKRSLSGFFWGDRAVQQKASEWSNLFKSRNGGYTRIIKLGSRRGDGAEVCRIEFVEQLSNPKPVVEDSESKSKPQA